MKTLASRLGEWVSALHLPEIPIDLHAKAKDHLLDTIGAAIAGDGRRPVRIAAQVFRAPGDTPLLIDGAPRDPIDAARVNAVAAHAAEIDDTEGCDHTGAVVVPTLLSLAHAGRLGSGADLIAAMIAGYEVGRRVQNALGGYDAHNGAGWHSTATCGVFAAAAAAARAMSLDAEQCASALALAASSSAGTWAFAEDGSMAKQLHAANAAGGGLQAAMLARAGAAGPTAIFEDVWGGYFTTHGARSARPGELVTDLGERWHAGHSAVKMYAACRSAHPAIDGVIDALRGDEVSSEEIRSVRIELSPFLRRMICPEEPRTVEAARMSLPIALALLLLGQSLDPDAYLRFSDPEVARTLQMFSVAETEDLPSPQSVRVILGTASRDHVIERDTARGSQPMPFSAAEVRGKFRRLAEPRIGSARARALIDYVDSIGDAPLRRLPPVWEKPAPARVSASDREPTRPAGHTVP
ncbi:MmgE/PrpD family protein [Leucobacter sp. wl10]|uniref:MmgE/PrpD family protein n=1 Tax=Leucobacter sp. wl10 TaxID=2304677 RepID=UPI0013C370A0|nr:MmgE/PrpD family protein [Leucobacter sp. wl10]